MSTAEITTLTKQNNDLSHKVANLEQGISNAQKSLHRIEQGLFGDDEISHLGVIKELGKLRGYIIDVEAKVIVIEKTKVIEDALLKNDKGWVKWIIGAVGGVVFYILTLIKEHFFK